MKMKTNSMYIFFYQKWFICFKTIYKMQVICKWYFYKDMQQTNVNLMGWLYPVQNDTCKMTPET